MLRRPTLTPKGKDRGLPVSFRIDRATARLEMLPEFSLRRGVYDLDVALDVQRRGGRRATVKALSVLHPGDHLNVDLDIGGDGPMKVRADALEARGGALAGAIGLPADQPFAVDIDADGKESQGTFSAYATSGAARPLDASGSWTPQGGQARGRLSLAASTLTRGWMDRLGPEVTFLVTGRRAGENLFDLDARLNAENLGLEARGQGDPGKRQLGPRGVTLVAVSPNLSRITGGPPWAGRR
ncbi:hypothetical protein [Phenylobacterium sp. J367]|uniref:hypothetical protein n=1 Tax=Phenylobacterium sp. J367 TaxID=2898435 RepID=UPI00215097A2|nr:hypothetical protein [Phenylobacterium sp. J367]MCR5880056.1 hypothetical protein [Phenylobacterium sp. J367]